MSALDFAAKFVEQNGRELAESFLNAAKNGDWRAADALMNRIYGKPDVALVAGARPSTGWPLPPRSTGARSWRCTCKPCVAAIGEPQRL